MKNDFIFDDNESNGIWKKILAVVGVAALFLSILVALILTSVIDSANSCQKISERTGIYRCEDGQVFKQIIFVIGDTANTPKPVISAENSEIISTMYDVEGMGWDGLSYISVSNPDGVPQPFSTGRKDAEKTRKEVVKQIKESSARYNGADYLEAIRNAAFYAKDKKQTLIYVIGSGLSDSGLLNFAEDDLLISHGLDEITDAVSSNLEDKNELSGLTIFWEGLGDTVDPQEPLRKELKTKERKIYESILMELGVRRSDIVISNSTTTSEKNDQVETSVKTTPVENIGVVFDYHDDSELAFVPGEATFRDRDAAEKEISELASKYKNSIFIIKPFMSRGMCNRDKDDNLLRSRAEATKQLLMSVGHVSAADIVMEEGEIGDANECPNGPGDYPVNDEAPKNRKVQISVIRK